MLSEDLSELQDTLETIEHFVFNTNVAHELTHAPSVKPAHSKAVSERILALARSLDVTFEDDFLVGYRLHTESLRGDRVADCANDEQRRGWQEAERQESADPDDSLHASGLDEDDA